VSAAKFGGGEKKKGASEEGKPGVGESKQGGGRHTSRPVHGAAPVKIAVLRRRKEQFARACVAVLQISGTTLVGHMY